MTIPVPRFIIAVVVLFTATLTAASCRGSDPSVDDISSAREWQAVVDLEITGLDEEGRGFLSPYEMHQAGTRSYVIHGQEQRIRVFDSSSGGSLRTLVGPDQMERPGSFGLMGDTLWVFERPPEPEFRLFSIETGALIGVRRAREEPRALKQGEQAIAGTHLISGEEMLARSSGSAYDAVEGDLRDRYLFRVSVLGEILDTLAAFSSAHGKMGFNRRGGGGVYGGQPFSDDPLHAFSPGFRDFASLDQTVTENKEEPHATLTVRDLQGQLRYSEEVRFAPRAIPRGWVEGVVREWQSRLGMAYSHSDPLIRELLYVPAHLPLADDLKVDADGRAWIRIWDPAELIPRYDFGTVPPDEIVWLVIGENGRPYGRVRLPAKVQWLYASGDAMWGTHDAPDGSGIITRYNLRDDLERQDP